jgi:hypothetical protein
MGRNWLISPRTEQKWTMSKQELEQLDELGIGAWDNHKPDAFVELFADDFVL